MTRTTKLQGSVGSSNLLIYFFEGDGQAMAPIKKRGCAIGVGLGKLSDSSVVADVTAGMTGRVLLYRELRLVESARGVPALHEHKKS